jgi:hypothetical protein
MSEMTDSARVRVRQLIGADEHLPETIRRDILGLGVSAVPPLLEILQDEMLALTEAPGGGFAPIHAARLLGELRTEEAIEPMLRALADTDPLDILHDQVIQSMLKIGPSVMEPALRAASDADSDLQDSLATILARIGVRDERILEMLISQLRRDPAYAGNLANYGDQRAVPHLFEALDQYKIVDTENPFSNHALVELREAIEELGGSLTAEQKQKCQRGLRQAQAFQHTLRALIDKKHPMKGERGGRRGLLGRNDPCWCGSGIKYKKCHLAVDERTAFGLPPS